MTMTPGFLPAVSAVQVDNSRVRVTEWRIPPGGATGHHRHEMDYVITPVIGGALTIVDAAGADHQYRGFTNDAPADIYWNRLRKTLPCLGWRADDSSDSRIAEALRAVAPDFDAAEASKKTVKHASKTAKTIRDLYADVVFRTTKGATPRVGEEVGEGSQ